MVAVEDAWGDRGKTGGWESPSGGSWWDGWLGKGRARKRQWTQPIWGQRLRPVVRVPGRVLLQVQIYSPATSQWYHNGVVS